MEASVKYIQLYGERCSGTNYLTCLIRKNLNATIENYQIFGQKHWHIFTEGDPTAHDLNEWLFIIIHRNPWDWIRSLFQWKHHFTGRMQNSTFSQLLRCPYGTSNWSGKIKNLNDHIDPATDEVYQNILQMRTGKLRNHLSLKHLVPNIYIISYDQLVTNYPKIIRDISTQFGIPLIRDTIVNSEGYKHHRQKYIAKRYSEITLEDLKFIQTQLDMTLEKELGYLFPRDYIKNTDIKYGI